MALLEGVLEPEGELDDEAVTVAVPDRLGLTEAVPLLVPTPVGVGRGLPERELE